MRTRLTLIALAVAALAATACGAAGHATASTTTALAGCDPSSLNLVSTGTLTIGTDNPAYPPWYAGGTPKGSKWKINDPSTGKGFESAVAYAVATQLGFTKSQVTWIYVPFNKAFAPGKKSFDFDINQISYTPARAKVVSFSVSYYDVNQAIVVNKGTQDRVGGLGRRAEAVQARGRSSGRRATRSSSRDRAVAAAGGLPVERRRRAQR